MSGLIWSALGEGVGNIGNAMSSYLAREADREDRQEERRRELEERRAYEERRDAMYKRTADQQAAASRSGSSSSRAREYTPDEMNMAAVGSGNFTSIPDVERFRNAVKTGDYSSYQQDVTRGKVSDQGDPYNPDVALETTREYPPGFEKVIQSKAKTLSDISRESVHGKDLKDVAEGRQTELETDIGRGILSGEISPGRGAAAAGGIKGNKVFDGDSNVTRNVYDGTTTTTPVGDSVAAENKAQGRQADALAGKARAEGGLASAKRDAIKGGGDDPDMDPNAKTADLQRQITSARTRLARELGVAENEINATLASLQKRNTQEARDRLEKIRPFLEKYDAALTTMDNWRPGKSRKPEETGGSGLPEPKSESEFARLPKGTRYKAPDGTIRIK